MHRLRSLAHHTWKMSKVQSSLSCISLTCRSPLPIATYSLLGQHSACRPLYHHSLPEAHRHSGAVCQWGPTPNCICYLHSCLCSTCPSWPDSPWHSLRHILAPGNMLSSTAAENSQNQVVDCMPVPSYNVVYFVAGLTFHVQEMQGGPDKAIRLEPD